MSVIPPPEKRIICHETLGKRKPEPCLKHYENCPKYVKVNMDGQEFVGCADMVNPLVHMGMVNRINQMGAAVESLRNNVAKSHDEMMRAFEAQQLIDDGRPIRKIQAIDVG